MQPILEHTKFLQREYDERNGNKETSIEKKFQDILQELQTQAKSLQTQAERLQNIEENLARSRSSTLDTYPFRKIGEKYYYFENNRKINWFAAHHYCLTLGAHLASVQSKAEIDALTIESKHLYYWIDLNDLSIEGEFRSSATGKIATYLNWAPNEPNNAGTDEDCVVLVTSNSGKYMNDEGCSTKPNYFICEKDFSK